MIRSIVINGIASSTASFLSNQTDVDLKKERLRELLIEINSAIEFGKERESILNSSLREWLNDLQKAWKEGEQVQSAFQEQTEDPKSINPWKVAVRLYQRSKRVNSLNATVMRLERKASKCEKFLQMLRDEQRHQIFTQRVEKLEHKMARLERKKTKRAHGKMRTDDGTPNTSISSPQFGDRSHDEPEIKEDPISEQEIQEQRPDRGLTTVPISGGWGELNSSPAAGSYDAVHNNSGTTNKAAAEATQMPPAEPVRTRRERNTSRNDASFHERPTKRLAVPKFGEWEDRNSSSVRGDHSYTMCFDNARMKKGDAKATPIQIPAKPARMPEKNEHRSAISLLLKLFACISLKARN